ncbi:hypothetical protein R3P38DRAFT_940841 [Favolaschia claudopus]|uniref:Uncharacterized protein n=1 Tax=Favolaschia claudopus TaxID=2862362 RepID=A0AAW0BKL1_9AGAR
MKDTEISRTHQCCPPRSIPAPGPCLARYICTIRSMVEGFAVCSSDASTGEGISAGRVIRYIQQIPKQLRIPASTVIAEGSSKVFVSSHQFARSGQDSVNVEEGCIQCRMDILKESFTTLARSGQVRRQLPPASPPSQQNAVELSCQCQGYRYRSFTRVNCSTRLQKRDDEVTFVLRCFFDQVAVVALQNCFFSVSKEFKPSKEFERSQPRASQRIQEPTRARALR